MSIKFRFLLKLEEGRVILVTGAAGPAPYNLNDTRHTSHLRDPRTFSLIPRTTTTLATL